jgi:hypothetical protein
MADKENEKLDALIRSSLAQEETVPAALQADLIKQIRNQKTGRIMPWWLPAAIGGMQTAAFVAGVNLLLPDSLFSYLTTLAGAFLILCAGVLSVLAHKKWKESESLS